MKKIRKLLIMVLLALYLLGVAVTIFVFVSNGFTLTQDARVSELLICDGAITRIKNSAIVCGETFRSDSEKLFVCGTLETELVSVDVMSVYLYRDGAGRPIYSSPPRLTTYRGDFCHELILPTERVTGNYEVKIYFYRELLASKAFVIK